MEDGNYELKPDANSRSRLHKVKSKRLGSTDLWEVVFATVDLPVTGATTLVHSKTVNGYVIKPNESPLKDVKKFTGRNNKSPVNRDRQDLPLNIPPKEHLVAAPQSMTEIIESFCPDLAEEDESQPIKSRSKVGVASTPEDIKIALDFLNDALQRLEGIEVEIFVEKDSEKQRVRAKMTQVTIL